MRLAVLADLHGNLVAFEAVMAALGREGFLPADMAIAGDIAMVGPQPAELVAQVRRLQSAGAAVVGGNTDRWGSDYLPDNYAPTSPAQAFLVGAYRLAQQSLSAEDWQWLTTLPTCRRLPDTRAPGVLVVHGSPTSESEGIFPEASDDELLQHLASLPPDIAVLACAHSHRPLVRPVVGRLVVNAGAVGRPADGDPRACYAVLSFEKHRWTAVIHRVAYDAARAVAVAHARGIPGADWYASSLETGTLEGRAAAG